MIPSLRFGGEDAVARFDPTISSQVIGSDPIAAADLGLRNIDRVMTMLIPATTARGKDYSKLAEMYHALLNTRNNELGAVAKLVGGVEETRYQAGRGGIPFTPVPAGASASGGQVSRSTGPSGRTTACWIPEVLMRITPTGGSGGRAGLQRGAVVPVTVRPSGVSADGGGEDAQRRTGAATWGSTC